MALANSAVLQPIGLVEVEGGKASKMKDFEPLKQQFADVNPQGVSMSDYSPSGKGRECPTVNSTWASSAKLPPTPNQDACDCMVKAASCVPVENLDVSGYKPMFDYICDNDGDACSGISGNVSEGTYGTYSMCSDKAKLTYLLDAYYKSQKQASTACDFDGNATTQSGSGDISSCDEKAKSGSSSGSGDNGDSAASPSAIVGSMQLYSFLALVSVAMVFL